jgi:uracil-DNA glycosylase
MSIEFKAEDKNFFNAEEQYILCIANCVNSKLDRTKEPLTTALFTKFPEANIYKERGADKGKPGTLFIRGKLAIILGTVYPGTKEYANDNRDLRIKWFREGLLALQRMSPTSIAVREHFSEEFGGDWNKYLYHLNEMHKSIKVAVYPYVMAIPLFNVVRFRQEDQPIVPISVAPINSSTLANQGTKKLPMMIKNKILPIKIEDEPTTITDSFKISSKVLAAIAEQDDDRVPDLRAQAPEVWDSNVVSVTSTPSKDVAKEIEVKKEVVASSKPKAATYEWIDLTTFPINGWDPIMKQPSVTQKLQQINKYFIDTEIPKFGEYFRSFPPQNLIFNAFNLCPLDKVRVVVIGQDCYIHDGEAMGLAFSVPVGVKLPPTLRNIYKELSSDIPNFKEPNHGNLESWASQGVFLINSALTVREGKSGSHMDVWQSLTDQIIGQLSQYKNNLVFILWGNPAKKKLNVIKNVENHCILTAAHPSPLSANKGFFGCKCFSQTNNYLVSKGLTPIDWNLP